MWNLTTSWAWIWDGTVYTIPVAIGSVVQNNHTWFSILRIFHRWHSSRNCLLSILLCSLTVKIRFLMWVVLPSNYTVNSVVIIHWSIGRKQCIIWSTLVFIAYVLQTETFLQLFLAHSSSPMLHSTDRPRDIFGSESCFIYDFLKCIWFITFCTINSKFCTDISRKVTLSFKC